MDAHPVDAGIGEGGYEFVGVLDHHVAVKGQAGVLANGFDECRAEGEVGDEVAIHDVDVDGSAAAALGGLDLVCEA